MLKQLSRQSAAGRKRKDRGQALGLFLMALPMMIVVTIFSYIPMGGLIVAFKDYSYCDNNVVDHQVVNLEFDNGITASFTMCAFTWEGSRTVKIMGTHGQIAGDVEENEIRVVRFADGDTQLYHLDGGLEGHSGGDKGFMEDVVHQMRTGGAYAGRTGVDASVESHRIALAAEESRVTGRTINMKDFA